MREIEGNVDVAIIGGGPGGSTAAALLAAAGRRVVLFEKEVFPRFHIGESLLPFNVVLFERLGVIDKLEKRFLQKWGAQIMSSDGAVSRYIRFEESIVPGPPMAYHVLRSEFDEMLLRNAQSKGAEVLEGHAVIEATHSHRHGAMVTARARDGSMVRCKARFLVDASGREAFVASRRKLRDMTPHLRKAAVFAQYENIPRLTGRQAGDIILIVLKDGWFWMIPLPDGFTSVGLVAEGSRLKDLGLPPEELLEQAVRACPAAWERMRDARRISQVWSASDYSYECREVAGDGYVLVGDAAAFIDPIFSTGVWLAMSSGEIAADTLHKALGAGNLSPATFADYERKVHRHVATYTRIVSRFYQPGFMDIFLQPSTRFGIKEAVISLLAGMADPPPLVSLRLAWFYTVITLQQRFGFLPAVPLLGVMEKGRA